MSAAALPRTRPWHEADDISAQIAARRLSAAERDLVLAYRRDGFVIIEDDRILDGIDVDEIWRVLGPRFAADGSGRVQDAWIDLASVRAIAVHPAILATLRLLYGRDAVPFQTLNFLNGTEQRTHSDTIHFSSLPSGFMCGVWVALEDVTLRQGPLHYYPGSQRLPEFDYGDLGIPAVPGRPDWSNPLTLPAYQRYEAQIARIAGENGFRRAELAVKRGTYLIWSANLLHGGSPRDDRTLTRKSQVSHYFFADTVPITPMFSRRAEGAFHVRLLRDIGTGAHIRPRLDGVPVVFPPVDEHRRGVRPVAGLPGRLLDTLPRNPEVLPDSERHALRLAAKHLAPLTAVRRVRP
ncbi:MAG: phytanoyl-CoA dioxygenase family protein [Candidatus Eremiobacteraeota bacterium]|nr:phytanoyl-CoA dioxygenase family protein [Candidatus Eremiobacteraeota bacterium]